MTTDAGIGPQRNAIKQMYPTEPTGKTARHLQALAAVISGISQAEADCTLAWFDDVVAFSRSARAMGSHSVSIAEEEAGTPSSSLRNGKNRPAVLSIERWRYQQ